MTTTGTPREEKSRADEKTGEKDRRKKDRRQKDSEGFTYINVVGWICRREKKRRKLNQSEEVPMEGK